MPSVRSPRAAGCVLWTASQWCPPGAAPRTSLDADRSSRVRKYTCIFVYLMTWINKTKNKSTLIWKINLYFDKNGYFIFYQWSSEKYTNVKGGKWFRIIHNIFLGKTLRFLEGSKNMKNKKWKQIVLSILREYLVMKKFFNTNFLLSHRRFVNSNLILEKKTRHTREC